MSTQHSFKWIVGGDSLERIEKRAVHNQTCMARFMLGESAGYRVLYKKREISVPTMAVYKAEPSQSVPI